MRVMYSMCGHWDCGYYRNPISGPPPYGCIVTACINPKYNGLNTITSNRSLTDSEMEDALKKKYNTN